MAPVGVLTLVQILSERRKNQPTEAVCWAHGKLLDSIRFKFLNGQMETRFYCKYANQQYRMRIILYEHHVKGIKLL